MKWLHSGRRTERRINETRLHRESSARTHTKCSFLRARNTVSFRRDYGEEKVAKESIERVLIERLHSSLHSPVSPRDRLGEAMSRTHHERSSSVAQELFFLRAHSLAAISSEGRRDAKEGASNRITCERWEDSAPPSITYFVCLPYFAE